MRNRDGIPFVIAIVIMALIFAFYIYSLVHVHNNCHNGHVVKNIFDWPVCVH